MARSVKKGPFVDGHLLKKVDTARTGNDKRPIKTWSRRSTIIPEFIGMTLEGANRKERGPLLFYEHMGRQKLGEFALTRTFKGHTGGKKAAMKR